MKIRVGSILASQGFWALIFLLGLGEATLNAQVALKPVSGSTASALSYELNGEKLFLR